MLFISKLKISLSLIVAVGELIQPRLDRGIVQFESGLVGLGGKLQRPDGRQRTGSFVNSDRSRYLFGLVVVNETGRPGDTAAADRFGRPIREEIRTVDGGCGSDSRRGPE